MKSNVRLTRNNEIQRVRREGHSFVHNTVLINVLPNENELNRIAIIAGRSVGGAAQRNLAKRRIRSAFQSLTSQLNLGFDLVIIARRSILAVEYKILVEVLRELLYRAGMLRD